MEPKKEEHLFSTDENKWPDKIQPHIQVVQVNKDMPFLLEVSHRKVSEDLVRYTVESLQEEVKKLENTMASLEAAKLKYLQMIDFAKKNGVALTDDEAVRLSKIHQLKIAIEEKKKLEASPKNVAERKAMQRELKKLEEQA